MKALRVILLLVVGALAGLAAALYGVPYLQQSGLLKRDDSVVARTDGKASPGADKRDVNALGRFEPESEIIQVSAPAGGRIERLSDKVKEGATVSKGEPLAYLDSYAELQASRELAQKQLDEPHVSSNE